MFLEQERCYGLGIEAVGTDALVSRMRSKTEVITAWVGAKPSPRTD